MHPASVTGSTAASTSRRTSSALHPKARSESGRSHRGEQQRMMSNDHAAGQKGLLTHVRPRGPVPHMSPRTRPRITAISARLHTLSDSSESHWLRIC